MIGYSKSQQLGKTVTKPKKSANGNKVSATTRWELDRARLKIVYQSHNITSCEYVDVQGHRCGLNNFLTFAHDDKRRNLSTEEIASFWNTLLLCLTHHQLIENDREETERLFRLLRSKN